MDDRHLISRTADALLNRALLTFAIGAFAAAIVMVLVMAYALATLGPITK